MRLFRDAGPEEPAPYLIRGHPDVAPTKVGNHLKDWVPVFTGNPGFGPGSGPGVAGMTLPIEDGIHGQTLFNFRFLFKAVKGSRVDLQDFCSDFLVPFGLF